MLNCVQTYAHPNMAFYYYTFKNINVILKAHRAIISISSRSFLLVFEILDTDTVHSYCIIFIHTQ